MEDVHEEATIKEWKRLFELGMEFVKLKPWEYLWNEEYVCVRLSKEEAAYFKVNGVRYLCLIDVKRSHNDYCEYMTLVIPRSLKGIRLKK